MLGPRSVNMTFSRPKPTARNYKTNSLQLIKNNNNKFSGITSVTNVSVNKGLFGSNVNRLFCSEAEKPKKTFSPKIENIVDKMENLSQEESLILNEVILKVFNLRKVNFSGQSSQAAASSAGPVAEEKKEAAPPKDERFNVKIKAITGGVKAKFAIMKFVQTIQPDLSLQDRKAMVDSLPSIIAKVLPPEEAKDVQGKLLAIDGVEVELESV